MTIDDVRARLEDGRAGMVRMRVAVRLATVGGESPDLLSALVLAVLRLLREWGQLASLFAPLGVELPALPASIGGLGGGT